MKFNNFKKQGGFTIIETMIATSVFVVIITAGMGALLNANLIQQKTQDMRSIMDNLSFILEDMSRNLRTGYSYRCYPDGATTLPSTDPLETPRSCSSGWGIVFEHAEGAQGNQNDQWAYYIDSGGKLYKNTNGASGGSWIDLTLPEIVLDDSSGFSVLGAEGYSTDSQQPFVVIRLVGSITFKGVVTPFALQTSVSQRLVDI